MVACDLAIAAEEAKFGLSEINWGIIPAGNVMKSVTSVMNQRDAMYYTMTGETFDGRKAAAMGLVNEAVPLQPAAGADARARERAAREEPRCVARRQACLPARRAIWIGMRPRIICSPSSTRCAYQDREKGRDKGLHAVLGREVLPARPRWISPR